jgi:hypothetical protein
MAVLFSPSSNLQRAYPSLLRWLPTLVGLRAPGGSHENPTCSKSALRPTGINKRKNCVVASGHFDNSLLVLIF